MTALAMVAAMLLVVTKPAQAASNTFTVTNTDDGGAGSLRQAIINANNTSERASSNSTFRRPREIQTPAWRPSLPSRSCPP
jgi:hypothetical protein